MSNDPIWRTITNALNGYWKNHPIQLDLVHGTYHVGAGTFWGALGVVDATKNLVTFKGFQSDCFNKAGKDFKRTHDHWIKGENRNDRINYNKSPARSKLDPRHYTFTNCRE